MIRALQKKFVVTAMIAITALLILMLGAINVGNIVISNQETARTLAMISENEGDPRNLKPHPDPLPDDAQSIEPPTHDATPQGDYDAFMASNFFVVRFDAAGDPVAADVSRTAKVSETEAISLAQAALESGETSGRRGSYRYRVAQSRDGAGKTVVFLDTSGRSGTALRVLALSGAVGLVCWLVMLLLVILLSRRAIRPIAENMEKQRQFVTNAGHEIKTPLAIIQSNTEAMELYTGENKWSRNIKAQAQRLSDLTKNLLLLARMDEGMVPEQPDAFCVSTLLEQLLSDFCQPLEQRGVTMTESIAPQLVICAVRSQIAQLFAILLDNAVSYTQQNGTLHVALWKTHGGICLTAENTCERLPTAAPEKLFDRFFRDDAARTQSKGGCGIGLSVARAIAEANGGRIRADYLPPCSVRFTVELPAAQKGGRSGE